MSANNKDLFYTNGKLAPQYYNDQFDQYEVAKGANGAAFHSIVDANGNPINSSNRLPVDIQGATINATLGDQQAKIADNIILQNATTIVSVGTPFSVNAFKTITIEISGTSTSRTINFEACSVSGAYYPITGVKLLDYSMATSTTGNNEVWQFDITGMENFRTNVTSIVGGSVTVKGKAVA